ncbi:MAG TPA: hypothetical protein VJT09_11845 [Pyrinomonadaceae bacterium]|nr:hypothetical protein [Pyrinomonadaceae bacterium]
MDSTRNASGLTRSATNPVYESRLDWLLATNQWEAARQRMFRGPQEEEEMLLMHHPLTAREAFALFGLLLGMLPPIAIFFRILNGFAGTRWTDIFASGVFILLLILIAICGLVGKWMGDVMGRWLEDKDRLSWKRMLYESAVAGIAWGAVTGAAGGFLAFGVGALIGLVCAVAVGVTTFPLFSMFHRLMARGGMIDARHFWPLACGVALLVVALVLSPHTIPY